MGIYSECLFMIQMALVDFSDQITKIYHQGASMAQLTFEQPRGRHHTFEHRDEMRRDRIRGRSQNAFLNGERQRSPKFTRAQNGSGVNLGWCTGFGNLQVNHCQNHASQPTPVQPTHVRLPSDSSFWARCLALLPKNADSGTAFLNWC